MPNFVDKFLKAEIDTRMNPQLAFVVSILYMIASDGIIQNEEIGQLLAVLGGEEGPDGGAYLEEVLGGEQSLGGGGRDQGADRDRLEPGRAVVQ